MRKSDKVIEWCNKQKAKIEDDETIDVGNELLKWCNVQKERIQEEERTKTKQLISKVCPQIHNDTKELCKELDISVSKWIGKLVRRELEMWKASKCKS